jgi:iron complex transport system substrate-binding protein
LIRVVSLLPSATEIVFAIGAEASLVGVTHECDFPPTAAQIPPLTRSHIPAGIPSAQIDAAVSASLNSLGSLYELDFQRLEALKPDLILTQRLCDVCAVSFDRVEDAVSKLPWGPQVLNLEPHSLADVLGTIQTVGGALGRGEAAQKVVASLRARIEAVRERSAGATRRPRVLCLEWVDPPFCAGHWIPELIEIAGGRCDLGNLHRPSTRLQWSRVVESAPEVIVLTCCGYTLERCAADGEVLARFPGAQDLPAVREGRVYATDGSAYFSRPGPRLVESLEILAHIVHPQLFPAPRLERAFSRLDLARSVSSPS